jgi:hypothetical protein
MAQLALSFIPLVRRRLHLQLYMRRWTPESVLRHLGLQHRGAGAFHLGDDAAWVRWPRLRWVPPRLSPSRCIASKRGRARERDDQLLGTAASRVITSL